MHHAGTEKKKKTMTDTLLFTYYYLDLEIIKILVLISCHPALCIYLYPTPLTNTQMDFMPFGTVDLEQSEGRETPRGFT